MSAAGVTEADEIRFSVHAPRSTSDALLALASRWVQVSSEQRWSGRVVVRVGRLRVGVVVE
ncbi:hypothetical protein [Kineosporia succinea]|uniref:Uncharacterized protein n=1 Tax=Kineosporia succinea TaxID=84632 RepID=A0ABT9PB63_9ACTN|nr:hypothetical protein [Kineosporia succinea]MDP9829425.1 hypothetical protein [Kineosporia succinea]